MVLNNNLLHHQQSPWLTHKPNDGRLGRFNPTGPSGEPSINKWREDLTIPEYYSSNRSQFKEALSSFLSAFYWHTQCKKELQHHGTLTTPSTSRSHSTYMLEDGWKTSLASHKSTECLSCTVSNQHNIVGHSRFVSTWESVTTQCCIKYLKQHKVRMKDPCTILSKDWFSAFLGDASMLPESNKGYRYLQSKNCSLWLCN